MDSASTSARAQAGNNVGGARVANRRAAARGGRASQSGGGGDGGIGQPNNNIMRFYSEDGTGLKVGPVTVLVLSLSFMILVVMMHILNKFRAAIAG